MKTILKQILTVIPFIIAGCTNHSSVQYEVSNNSFLLRVKVIDNEVKVTLEEKQIPKQLSEGNYIYRAQVSGSKDTVFRLKDPSVTVSGQNLTIHGGIAGIEVEQSYYLPADKPYFEEHIVLNNKGKQKISLSEFEMGFPLEVKEKEGMIIPESSGDRLVAIPFRHRADDNNNVIHDYSLTEILEKPGWEYRPNFCLTKYLHVRSRHYFSDAWAWIHGNRSVGIFSFNQENLVYSVISPVKTPE